MGHNIDISYDAKNKITTISFEGNVIDTERLNGVDISKWVYPFHINGVRWYGLYEELKKVYMHNTFTIVFEGNTEDYEVLKSALKDKNIEVKEKFSKVIILYDDSQFMTKITINGKIFDTQRIEKRSIDEWIKPFSFKAAEWLGIFGEIESYLGNSFYNISFVGNQEDMKLLIDNAPEYVNVFYKPQVVSKKKPPQLNTAESVQTQSAAPETENTRLSKPDLNNINGIANGLIGGAKSEYFEMQNNDSGMLLFGKIAVIIAVICCIVFTIFMSRFLMILSVIPAVVFCVLAFTKGYKKLAICTFIVCIVLAVISWIIITIRWRMAFKDAFGDLDDAFSDANEAFKEANDALGKINDAMS